MVNKSEMLAFYILKNNSQLHVIYNNIQSSSFQSQIVQSLYSSYKSWEQNKIYAKTKF